MPFPADSDFTVSARDKTVLRQLGERVLTLAADPVMEERRRLWKKLNALEAERPMILTETCEVLDETVPVSTLQCEGEWARGMERVLRDKIFYAEDIRDDTVLEPRLTYTNVVHASDYGVQEVKQYGDDSQGRPSYAWTPPLKKLPDDLSKLHFRTFRVDWEATNRHRECLEQVFDGLLPVVNRNWYWWTQGLTWPAVLLIGLEELMLKMYEEPEGLHALMAFLRDDHLQALEWFESQGLLTPNNEDDYIGSGGGGYTDLLPQADYVPGRGARVKDLWGLSESQETVGVSPEMFAEFIFQYQLPVISRFGFACYGCCEPVDNRWHIIKRIPNLRRVSVSPWADVEKMSEYLGKDYVFSRKPHPAYISSEAWDEDLIRADLRETMVATRGLNVELVMKDVLTLANQPWRLGRWTEIAREVVDEVYG